MMSIILLCLFGLSFAAPNLQKDLIIPTESKNVVELSGTVLKKRIGSKFEAGEVLTPEDVDIISEYLVGVAVKASLNTFNGTIPGLDTKKILQVGLDLETTLEAVFREVLTRIGVENILRRMYAGEDVRAILPEAYLTEEVKMIMCKEFRRPHVKVVKKLLNQDSVIDDGCDEVAGVIYQVVSPVIGPAFYYSLVLDNGIGETRIGSEGPNGTSIMKGSFTIPLDGGDVATFHWVADENGYRVESPHLPTPPPAPPHVAQLLRIAEEQNAAGITFDG